MDQKRFLTADEVFQVFGVDSAALKALVESGDVAALADRGSFKYRSEDFVRLVQGGKLSPRTAGEMFEVDSQGDIPFLKIKGEDKGPKFGDDVSFIELDEDALADQASQNATTPQTPVIPENWFDDLAESGHGLKTSDTQDELEVTENAPASHDEVTEYELRLGEQPASDSDVQVLKDEGSIDFSEPDIPPSMSDSDVRLEGPVSSASMPVYNPPKAPDSDSDVRISASKSPKSDSDVKIAKGKLSGSESDSDVRVAKEASAKMDIDSDVRLAKSASGKSDSDSDVRIAESTSKSSESDSDVKIVTPNAVHGAKTSDSDSDVVIADSDHTEGRSPGKTDSDSDVRLADAAGLSTAADLSKTDSDIRLAPAHGAANNPSPVPTRTSGSDSIYDDDSGITLDNSDSGISLESAASDSGITLQGARTDSDMPVMSDADSGIAMESVHDSGITLDQGSSDSGISLETSGADSGIAVESIHDSGIAIETSSSDSGISLDHHRPDSGIALDMTATDSGITIDAGKPDSGISLQSGDSGIGLDLDSAASSGISLAKTDSGIAIIDEPSVDATLSDVDFGSSDSGSTQTLELSGEQTKDSAFDLSLAESERTMEMSVDDDDSSAAATILQKGRSKGVEQPSLSEAFDLDDESEVEELDISADLEGVPEAEYSGEFAEAEEEVLEASDDDFSAGEISVADEELGEDYVPAAKTRAVPKEPAWGMLAVAPIICASVLMAVAVTVLWGGIATMWSGGEPPAPASTLISTLAGLI